MMNYTKKPMQRTAHHFPHTIKVHLANVSLLKATRPKPLKQYFFHKRTVD